LPSTDDVKFQHGHGMRVLDQTQGLHFATEAREILLCGLNLWTQELNRQGQAIGQTDRSVDHPKLPLANRLTKLIAAHKNLAGLLRRLGDSFLVEGALFIVQGRWKIRPLRRVP